MDNNYNYTNGGTGNNSYAGGGYSSYGMYTNPQTGYNPYQQPVNNARPPQKPRKKGFGATLAKCAAIAIVFGLVAGGVFTGVSYAGLNVLGITADKKYSESSVPGKDNPKEKEDKNADKVQEWNNVTGSIGQTSTVPVGALSDVSGIAKSVLPSIVAITNVGTVTYQTFFGLQEYESQSCGSGIIVRQDDNYLYIVTNNHVVEGADTLTVQFVDNSTVSCEVKGTAPSNDLAVVKVELKNIDEKTLGEIKVATIGDSEALEVGEGAIAIGNALGYGQSVSVGHISALGRSVTVTDESTGRTIVNNNMIQTDAAINPGNSGGALLNAKGEVIGINSVKYNDTRVEGFGFAIPMADAAPIVEQLITREKVDEIKSAYLGIQGKDITSDIAATLNMPEGIYVYQVMKDSAAQECGLHQGDIITKFDGQSLSTMSELKELMTYYSAGEEVTITFQRLGDGYEEKEVTVKLGAQTGLYR